MQNIALKDALHRVRPGGGVLPYLEGFAAELCSTGYAEFSTVDYVRAAAHRGRWMDARDIGVEQCSEATIVGCAQHQCQGPNATRHRQRPSRRYVARVRTFAAYLGRLGVIPPLAGPSPRAVPTPLLGCRTWMIRHRGVTERTVKRYERLIERMLPALGSNPAVYDAALVRHVLLDEIRPLSCVYATMCVTALRAFLRFLAVEGRCRPSLDRSLPTVPAWKLSAVPRYLAAADVERLIASCDVHTPHGVRDRAILLLLARLGLRAGDIVAMQLADLDWDAATVRVQGKGRKEVRLPLPQDAGEALVESLVRARPSADTARVFLCAHAPMRPVATSAALADIVRLALQRAGVTNPPSKGAHVLRHAAATAMLRSGVSLDAIATVLRHASADTTAYYAKVDTALLQQMAQPWPEGAPCEAQPSPALLRGTAPWAASAKTRPASCATSPPSPSPTAMAMCAPRRSSPGRPKPPRPLGGGGDGSSSAASPSLCRRRTSAPRSLLHTRSAERSDSGGCRTSLRQTTSGFSSTLRHNSPPAAPCVQRPT